MTRLKMAESVSDVSTDPTVAGAILNNLGGPDDRARTRPCGDHTCNGPCDVDYQAYGGLCYLGRDQCEKEDDHEIQR